MPKRFTVETVFKAVDNFVKPVKKMTGSVGKFTRSARRGFRRMRDAVNKTAKAMKSVGRYAAIGLTAAAAGFGAIIKIGAEFQQTMTNAAAKFSDVNKRGTLVASMFGAIKDKAREIGRVTEFTATQAAEALNFLAMAGFDSKTAIASMTPVVNLATVAQTDLGTATSIAVDSLGAFGLMSGDAATKGKKLAMVTDLITKASISANMSIMDMFEAVKDGAPVAVRAGMSIKDTASAIALLAQSGIKGTRAGTALKRIALAVATPMSEAGRAIRALGVQTVHLVDGEKRIRNFFDIFKDLRKAMSRREQAEQLDIAEMIFGKIGLAGALGIIGQTDYEIGKLRERIDQYSGSAARMARIMRSTVMGSFKELRSAVESVALSIFESNEGPLNDIIKNMTKWVRANEELIAVKIGDVMKDIIDVAPDVIKVIGGIASAILDGVKAFKELKGLVSDLSKKVSNAPVKGPYIPKQLREQISEKRIAARTPEGKSLSMFDPRHVDDGTSSSPANISLEERSRRLRQEQIRERAEILIKTGPGVEAEVEKSNMGNGLKLLPSGG